MKWGDIKRPARLNQETLAWVINELQFALDNHRENHTGEPGALDTTAVVLQVYVDHFKRAMRGAG